MIITRRFPLALPGLFVATLAMMSCSKVPLLAPTGSTITVTATATALPVNGTTDIIAQVLESAGTPPQNGTVVTFTTTLGSIQPSEARTDGGRVTVKFSAGTTSGTATITAISGAAGPTTTTGTGTTATATTSNKVQIAIGAAAVTSITMTANPQTLGAAGGASTISAVARDASGNGLPGVPIAFTVGATGTAAATSGTVSPSFVVTGDSGIATTTLNTSATATVTATAGTSTSGTGTSSGSSITGSITVTVSPGPTITLTVTTPSSGPATVNQPVSVTVTTAAGTGGTAVRTVIVNWGDGQTTTAGVGTAIVSHTYRSFGFFQITGTATDVAGNPSTAQTSLQVNSLPKPTVSVSATRIGTTSGFTFSVTATLASNAPTGTTIQSVLLDFGDGSDPVQLGGASGVASTAQHNYSGNGQKTATATVTDSNGQTAIGATVVVF